MNQKIKLPEITTEERHWIVERPQPEVPSQGQIPAWHDAPTVPGLWACRQFITDRVQAYEVTDEVAFNKNLGLKGRWYGPIPPDGDKP